MARLLPHRRQRSFFFYPFTKSLIGETCYEHPAKPQLPLGKPAGAGRLALSGHVGHRRPADLPGHPPRHGAVAAAAHGLWHHSGQHSVLRRHRPAACLRRGGARRADHPLQRRHRQRAVPADSVHRHRRNDRLWPAAVQPQADDLRRGSPVRHFLHTVRGVDVL